MTKEKISLSDIDRLDLSDIKSDKGDSNKTLIKEFEELAIIQRPKDKMNGTIYEPRGKAFEYSPLAANLYRGCSHGCVYCYAPSATFKKRDLFHSQEFISPRAKILEKFESDCIEISGDSRECLLSFTTDAYQELDQETELTREALKIAKKHDVFITILTKGGLRATRDFDILSSMRSKFGVSLTTDNENESLFYEPGAAKPAERIESLEDAWTAGISTFVSFEPVINPAAVIRLIDITHEFVDFYKVGKINYHPLSKQIDWVEFRCRVVEKLESLGKKYMIKKDLAESK